MLGTPPRSSPAALAAITHFTTAVQLDPNESKALYQLAMLAVEAGKNAEAMRYLQRLTRLTLQRPTGGTLEQQGYSRPATDADQHGLEEMSPQQRQGRTEPRQGRTGQPDTFTRVPGHSSAHPSPPLGRSRRATPEPSQYVRDVFGDLLRLSHTSTHEINYKLAKLAQRDAGVVTAIQELLTVEDEARFAALSNLPEADVKTTRLRLIEALQFIGSPAALNAMVEVLHMTIQPAEIAFLATSVEAQAPGKFREDILVAAQAALRAAMANPKEALKTLGDPQPLLPIFVAYGDAASVADLEEAWPRLIPIATVALAELPDGAGIESLIRFVRDPQVPDRRKNFPVQILAQASRVYPEAGEALIALAEAKQLTGPAWTALAMALGGTETVLRTVIPIQPGQNQASGQAVLGPPGVIQILR